MAMKKQFLQLQKAEMSELKKKMRDRKAASENKKHQQTNGEGEMWKNIAVFIVNNSHNCGTENNIA